jgi:hypothetical protein
MNLNSTEVQNLSANYEYNIVNKEERTEMDAADYERVIPKKQLKTEKNK